MGTKSDSEFEVKCYNLVEKYSRVFGIEDPELLRFQILDQARVAIPISFIKKWIPFLKEKNEVKQSE